MDATERQLRWAIITLMVVVAVDVLGLLLILPILDTFSQSLGASKALVGTLFTVYSASSIFSSLVVGKLSDLYGRKKIFLLSAFGSFVSAMACIFVTTFTEFLIASSFSGLFTGTVGTAYAYVGDLVPDEKKRSKYISYITASMSMCLVLGPLVGGSISTLSLRAPFMISSAIALLEVFLVVGFLKNPEELQAFKDQQYSLLSHPVSESNPDLEEENNRESQLLNASTVSIDAVSLQTVHPDTFHHTKRDSQDDPYLRTSESEGSSMSHSDAADIISALHSRQQPHGTHTAKRSFSASTPLHPPHHLHSSSLHTVNTNGSNNPLPPPSFDQSASLVTVIVDNDDDEDEHDEEYASRSFGRRFGRRTKKSKSKSSGAQRNDSSSSALSTTTKAGSPWLDYRAVLVGGFGIFLNVTTYLGLVAIVPLLLQEERFGIVSTDKSEPVSVSYQLSRWTSAIASSLSSLLMQSKDGGTDNNSNNDDDLTASQIRRISLLMGLYLGVYGVTQVLGMLFLFPRSSRRLGLLWTGCLGSLIYGGIYLLVPVIDSVDGFYFIFLGMAVGNSLCRPVFPSYLAVLAPATRRAEYMTLSATFSNLALMIAGQMTLLYTYSAYGAMLLCAAASLLNALLLALFAVYNPVVPSSAATTVTAASDTPKASTNQSGGARTSTATRKEGGGEHMSDAERDAMVVRAISDQFPPSNNNVNTTMTTQSSRVSNISVPETASQRYTSSYLLANNSNSLGSRDSF